jgi:hypothetical protein
MYISKNDLIEYNAMKKYIYKKELYNDFIDFKIDNYFKILDHIEKNKPNTSDLNTCCGLIDILDEFDFYDKIIIRNKENHKDYKIKNVRYESDDDSFGGFCFIEI